MATEGKFQVMPHRFAAFRAERFELIEERFGHLNSKLLRPLRPRHACLSGWVPRTILHCNSTLPR